MAITTVKGEVTRTFHNGTGAEVTETFTIKGEQVKKRWSCWFEAAHGLNDGDTVEVSGLHSDKVDSWETKEGETRHTVHRALNRCKIAGSKAEPVQESEPMNVLPADESTPF